MAKSYTLYSPGMNLSKFYISSLTDPFHKMLQTVIDVSRNYGHVYLASLIGGIIALAFSAWFSVTLVAIYVAFSPTKEQNGACNANGGNCSNAKVIGLIVFITFAGYWITEFIKNVLRKSSFYCNIALCLPT